MKKIIFIYLALTLALSGNALAYIDPGTGGVFLNTIWPAIIAFFSAIIAFFIKWFWNPIKKLFGKTRNAAKEK